MLDDDALNEWRNSLSLPFTSIKTAKTLQVALVVKYERASSEAEKLLEEFKTAFSGKARPIYLHRSSNSASKSLKWRLSASKMYGFETNAKVLSNLHSTSVISILQKSGMESELINKIVELDFKRLYVNYFLNYSYNELNRVNGFIEDFEHWRKLPSQIM